MTNSSPSSPSRKGAVITVAALLVAGVSYGVYAMFAQQQRPAETSASEAVAAADDRLIIEMQVLQKGVGGAIVEIKGAGPAARQTLYVSVQDLPPTITRPSEQVVLLAGEEGGTPSFVSAPNEDDVIVTAPVSWLYAPSATAKRIKFCLAAGHNPEEIKTNMLKTQEAWKLPDAKACRSIEVSD